MFSAASPAALFFCAAAKAARICGGLDKTAQRNQNSPNFTAVGSDLA
jgi:hypothetical protein